MYLHLQNLPSELVQMSKKLSKFELKFSAFVAKLISLNLISKLFQKLQDKFKDEISGIEDELKGLINKYRNP